MAGNVVIPFVPLIDFAIPTSGEIVWNTARANQMLNLVKTSYPTLARIASVSIVSPQTLLITAVIAGVVMTLATVNLANCCPECLPGQILKPAPICCTNPPPPPNVEKQIDPKTNFIWAQKRTIYRYVLQKITTSGVVTTLDDECLMELNAPVQLPSFNPNPGFIPISEQVDCFTVNPGPEQYAQSDSYWMMDRIPTNLVWMSDPQRSNLFIPKAGGYQIKGTGLSYATVKVSDENRFPCILDGSSFNPFNLFGLVNIGESRPQTATKGNRLIREMYTAWEIYTTTTNNSAATRSLVDKGNLRHSRQVIDYNTSCNLNNTCCQVGQNLYKITYTYTSLAKLTLKRPNGAILLDATINPSFVFAGTFCAETMVLGVFSIPEFDIGLISDATLRARVQNLITTFNAIYRGGLNMSVKVERV